MPATTLKINPHRPFTVGLRDIGRSPGTSYAFLADLEAPADLSVGLLGIPAGSPVAVDLTLESVVEGVWVSGTTSADLLGECSRCLDPIRHHVQAGIAELFAYEESTTAHTTDVDGTAEGGAVGDGIRVIHGEAIDLEPAVRDALLIEAPLVPLCRADCQGLCPTCGERLDELPADHTHEVIDPRFAALADRFSRSGAHGVHPSDSPQSDSQP